MESSSSFFPLKSSATLFDTTRSLLNYHQGFGGDDEGRVNDKTTKWASGLFDDDFILGVSSTNSSSSTSSNEFQPSHFLHDHHHHHHHHRHPANEASLLAVRDLVRSSQKLVQQERNEDPSLLFDDPLLLQLLEPTPLGPRETQTIVSKLSLADIAYWRGGYHHHHHNNDNQDLISPLTSFGNGSTSDSASSNKKRAACNDDENNRFLAGTSLLPNQGNKKYKSLIHSTESELEHAMSHRLPTAQEEAQDNLIITFDNETMIQATTTTSSSCGPNNSNQLSQPQKQQPITRSSNNNNQNDDDDDDYNSNQSWTKPIILPTKNMLHRHHLDQWNDRFQDLIDFKTLNGHCLVPHDYPTNPKLAQWVKRQRYQHRLKHSGRHSTMTDSREYALEEMGFVWDSHKAGWTEKLETLKLFKAFHGHCNVPSNYDSDPSLAIWVKCQRRQYRLYCQGTQQSTMNDERVSALNALEFDWNPRRIL